MPDRATRAGVIHSGAKRTGRDAGIVGGNPIMCREDVICDGGVFRRMGCAVESIYSKTVSSALNRHKDSVGCGNERGAVVSQGTWVEVVRRGPLDRIQV